MEGKESKQKQGPREQHLSKDAALAVIRKSLAVGRLRIIPYFRMRMRDRGFNTVDVERVICSGIICEQPEYCIRNDNWKYRVRAPVDGLILEVVVAVEHSEDYDLQPLAVPITGYWTGEGTRDGQRTNGKEKGNRRKAAKKIR